VDIGCTIGAGICVGVFVFEGAVYMYQECALAEPEEPGGPSEYELVALSLRPGQIRD